jgi:uncharacterized protein (DUF2267 family)
MEYSEFLGQLQHRLELDSQQAAVTAARATLTTLGERLDPGEANDLASQLPREIGRFLRESEDVEGFSWEVFVDRVVEREGMDEDDRADAVYHARVVVALVDEATDSGEFADVRSQLPEAYDDLFALLDDGATPE